MTNKTLSRKRKLLIKINIALSLATHKVTRYAQAVELKQKVVMAMVFKEQDKDVPEY